MAQAGWFCSTQAARARQPISSSGVPRGHPATRLPAVPSASNCGARRSPGLNRKAASAVACGVVGAQAREGSAGRGGGARLRPTFPEVWRQQEARAALPMRPPRARSWQARRSVVRCAFGLHPKCSVKKGTKAGLPCSKGGSKEGEKGGRTCGGGVHMRWQHPPVAAQGAAQGKCEAPAVLNPKLSRSAWNIEGGESCGHDS
jgi:hypothetical protein